MNITRDVVTDLLPLYFSKECSRDTKTLVEEFLKADPDLARQARDLHDVLPAAIPQSLTSRDELTSLGKTRRLLRTRSIMMGLAIFCSLTPFSFIYTQGKMYWLLSESPTGGIIYGILGIVFWGAYIFMKRRTSDL